MQEEKKTSAFKRITQTLGQKTKYYSTEHIDATGALYRVVIGKRSNGKTYSVLAKALELYLTKGQQLAIVRRWDEDFRGKRGQQMWDSIVANGLVKKLSKGVWTDVYYYSARWYLCRYEGEDGDKGGKRRVIDETPIAYGFSITGQEHDKSTSYPRVMTILFDEFISRNAYQNEEFVNFQNVLSTIIRQRKGIIIYMLGNTVNKFCPYFQEMGLVHVKNQKPGTIDMYSYGDSGLTVAVEYCDVNTASKQSDVYFSFDNPKLKMITQGVWEINIYPHLPRKYRPMDVQYRYYIIWDREVLQAEIIVQEDTTFTYIHQWTSEINDPLALVFTANWDARPQYRRKINNPPDELGRKVWEYWKTDKVFYQDNTVGEICRNYLLWCGNGLLK